MSKPKQNIQYYTMALDKFMELLSDSQKDFSIICHVMKEKINTSDTDKWDENGTSDIIETFVIIRSLKMILDKKLTNPPKEEVDFCAKNKITDVLMTETELFAIQSFVKSIELQKETIKSLYKIDTTIH